MTQQEHSILDIVLSEIRGIREILEGKEGVVVRLDRVEQDHKRHKWVQRAVFVAVIGAAATAVAGIILR